MQVEDERRHADQYKEQVRCKNKYQYTTVNNKHTELLQKAIYCMTNSFLVAFSILASSS